MFVEQVKYINKRDETSGTVPSCVHGRVMEIVSEPVQVLSAIDLK